MAELLDVKCPTQRDGNFMISKPGEDRHSQQFDGRLGVVVIGRNEAPRLGRTLAALANQPGYITYVDSGSIDGSPEIAAHAGVNVVRLTDGPFSAARGRTAGVEQLLLEHPDLEYIQFIDGDCAISDGWMQDAATFLDEHPEAGAVAGRLREVDADTSFLVRLIDVEWDLPDGVIDVVGGISLMRVEALRKAGGWCADMIAGEELDLSARLRSAGYTLYRLPRDMCLHDIGITRLSEFWMRSVRTGHSYAELAFLHHSNGPNRWLKRTLGHAFYGLLLPAAGVAAACLYWPVATVIVAIYTFLIVRIARWRLGRGDPSNVAFVYAALITVCKVAAGIGMLKFFRSHLTGRRSTLIEYKAPSTEKPTLDGGN